MIIPAGETPPAVSAQTAAQVDTPSNAYGIMAGLWALPRTLMGGTKAMRLAGEAYLPKEPGESQTAYLNRLSRTTLYNAFKRTVYTLVGKPFSKDIVRKDIPAEVEPLLENIDLAGRNLTIFLKDLLVDAVSNGISYILVEFPPQLPNIQNPDGTVRRPSLAEERELGRRPYWVNVNSANLIFAYVERVQGKDRLIHARIKEDATVRDGPYGERTVNRIRVLEPGRWELWEKQTNGQWSQIDQGITSVKDIPLVAVYGRRVAAFQGEPPLEDLADLNVAHWQSSSDQRHILHFARVPILVATGWLTDDLNSHHYAERSPDNVEVTVDEDNQITSRRQTGLEIGPNRILYAPTGADLKIVEHTGASIEAGERDLTKLEDMMGAVGASLLVQRPGNPTATAKTLDTVESNSELGTIVQSLQDAAEQALVYTGEYLGISPDASGELVIHKDFGISLRDFQDLGELLKARLAGEIDRQTYLNEIKRRGMIADDTDVEAVIRKAQEEMPDPVDPNANTGENE